MNRTQKAAWYGVLLAGLLSSVVLIDMYEKFLGTLWTHLIGYCVLLPLLLVPLFLLQRKKIRGEADFDERDKLICKRALLTAFILISAIFLVTYIVVYFGFNQNHSIPVSRLPEILYGSAIIFILTLSIAVLVQYGWKEEKKNE